MAARSLPGRKILPYPLQHGVVPDTGGYEGLPASRCYRRCPDAATESPYRVSAINSMFTRRTKSQLFQLILPGPNMEITTRVKSIRMVNPSLRIFSGVVR